MLPLMLMLAATLQQPAGEPYPIPGDLFLLGAENYYRGRVPQVIVTKAPF